MAIVVAHAAPSTPIPSQKMKTGSRTRFVPKPTIMHVIEPIAPPSARMSAEKPKARWEKRWEKRTILR